MESIIQISTSTYQLKELTRLSSPYKLRVSKNTYKVYQALINNSVDEYFGTPNGSLVELTDLSISTVKHHLKTLERLGYIVRYYDLKNKRWRLVAATDKPFNYTPKKPRMKNQTKLQDSSDLKPEVDALKEKIKDLEQELERVEDLLISIISSVDKTPSMDCTSRPNADRYKWPKNLPHPLVFEKNSSPRYSLEHSSTRRGIDLSIPIDSFILSRKKSLIKSDEDLVRKKYLEGREESEERGKQNRFIDSPVLGMERAAPVPRGSRISPDFSITDDMRKYAKSHLINETTLQRVVEDFRDFWLSNASSKAIKRDWEAAFRMWIRKGVYEFKNIAIDPSLAPWKFTSLSGTQYTLESIGDNYYELNGVKVYKNCNVCNNWLQSDLSDSYCCPHHGKKKIQPSLFTYAQ